jgi:hypothetical protein
MYAKFSMSFLSMLIFLGVVGCTPGPQPVVGVDLIPSGDLQIHTAPCRGGAATQYAVYGRKENADNSAQFWIVTRRSKNYMKSKITAFNAPPNGWNMSRRGDNSLHGNYVYDVYVEMTDGRRLRNGEIHFSISDLRNIPQGGILVRVDDRNKVMTYYDFKKLAHKGC